MIASFLFMLCIGALCSVVLSFASKVFYVYEDPRIALIEENLEGANCGGCGYTGCSAAAQAIVEGKAFPNVCVISSSSEKVEAIAAVVGMPIGTAEVSLSYNMCNGGNRATDKYHYLGVNSCKAMEIEFGGKRDCRIGCLGLGDCVKVCSFNALIIGKEGFPIVDDEKCIGCGACEKVCPKKIIKVRTLSEKLLKLNQLHDPLAPCSQTCPAEIDIPRYIALAKEGKYKEAVSVIRMRNPLPLACGRVCPHPCENKCRRGIEDDPVSINQIKRFVADYEMETGSRIPIKCAPSTGKKVAVIGSGPSGLSCAYFLRRLGHEVSIFEAMPKLGGMIRYGIPEYRLPDKVLDWEIDGILNLGINTYTHVKFGKDFDLGALVASGYRAVFLGIGAWKDYALGIEGEDLEGCFTGINFLSRASQGEKLNLGKKACVIGGGNTAIDCVRTLLRLGLEKVYLVYRRTRKEMPANEVEIVAAEEEGIEFVFLAAPTKVIGNELGHVTQLEYLKMELGEPDNSGRSRPEPVEGSETLIDVDTIITAIGQSPEASYKNQDLHSRMTELELTRWNTIENDYEVLTTSIPYVFTAGDAATGPSLVVEAIGGGRRAARSIDMFLKGEKITPIPDSLLQKRIQESIFTEVPGVNEIQRAKMPELPVSKRLNSFVEVDLVLSEEDAKKEANRCLNCCRLCYNPDK